MQSADDAPLDGEESNEKLRSAFNSFRETEAFRQMVQPLAERFADMIQPYATEMTRSFNEQMAWMTEEVTRGIAAQMAAINEAIGTPPWPKQLLQSMQPLMESWSESMSPVFEQIRALVGDALPDNWRDADLDGDKLREILVVDGIPLGWVPRANIVSLLMAHESRPERIDLLMDRRPQLRSDCLECLDVVDDPSLSEWADLARKAIAAWEAGHDEAAQAVATITAESVITRRIAKPARAVEMAAESWETMPTLRRAKMAIALGPLVGFYQKWFPGDGIAPLTTLSRHTTVHHPSAVQVNSENCMLSIMLLCSVLRAVHEVALDMRGEAA